MQRPLLLEPARPRAASVAPRAAPRAVPRAVPRAATRDAHPAPSRRDDVDRLRSLIAGRLREAGSPLPEAALSALAEEVLADALRLALDWLEPHDAAPHDTAPPAA